MLFFVKWYHRSPIDLKLKLCMQVEYGGRLMAILFFSAFDFQSLDATGRSCTEEPIDEVTVLVALCLIPQ